MLDRFKSFFEAFSKKYLSKKNIKKLIGPIIIAVLTVLIPLSIAICYSQFIKSTQRIESPDISISLFDADGRLIASTTTQEDIVDASPLASVFYKLSFSKVRAQKPAEFDKKQNMSYTITYGSQKTTYKCYFEEDSTLSYLEDESGGFFAPDALAYSMFLSSEYSETIYEGSVPPTLCTPLNDEILPNDVEWNYILADGSERLSKNYTLTDEALTYRIAGAINVIFARKPDVCAITVKSLSGNTIFSGSSEDLASLTVEENTELLVSVNAKWKRSEDAISYGYQHYDFKIICAEPSTFSISSTEAVGGQILLLTVSDVDDVDSIFYAPSTALDDEEDNASLKALYAYSPIFVKDGSNAYGLLPIPADIPDTEFTFSLSCGISKESITVSLKQSVSTSMTTDSAIITDAQKAEFARILFYLKHSRSDALLLKGDFAFPDTYGFTQTQKYNTQINDSFTLLGNSYTAGSKIGISVKSASIGIVSEVGYSPLLGNYVIVDHGMGILTWYCGLSDVSACESDIVKKGDPIGRAGSSSILCENGVNIICSVGGILVDPMELVGD